MSELIPFNLASALNDLNGEIGNLWEEYTALKAKTDKLLAALHDIDLLNSAPLDGSDIKFQFATALARQAIAEFKGDEK